MAGKGQPPFTLSRRQARVHSRIRRAQGMARRLTASGETPSSN
ncbi:hypothetical protein PXO_05815 [Xanthomonas oryzae pv. oryzae PXO99A]|uniref:Uncharacterized protein n=1 Tax=Xanthomonas oryzae pv. oryzae (strain PXO99A) TaxID=360094 RepID=A0A0K0GH62_XANOP|nr:hypothetical protein PXO_05815 [Xanthomonas oryzae pv. oryzae PXO99A]